MDPIKPTNIPSIQYILYPNQQLTSLGYINSHQRAAQDNCKCSKTSQTWQCIHWQNRYKT